MPATARPLLTLCLVLFAAACARADEIELRWRLPAEGVIGYAATLTAEPRPGAELISARNLCRTGALPDAIRDELAAMLETPPDTLGDHALLRPALFGDGLQLQFIYGSSGAEKMVAKMMGQMTARMIEDMKNGRSDQLPPALRDKDEDEVIAVVEDKIRELWLSFENKVIMEGTISRTGRADPLTLESQEINLVHLMFRLPDEPVAVGDTWHLGVDLLDAGANTDTNDDIAVATLSELIESDGHTIAVIDVVAAEYATGTLHTTPRRYFRVGFAYVGRGEFLVEEGRWARYVGRMSTDMEDTHGIPPSETVTYLVHTPEILPAVLTAEKPASKSIEIRWD